MYEVTEKYDEISNSASFVCAETWSPLKKWSGGSYSMLSPQTENRLSMAAYLCVYMMLLALYTCSMTCNRPHWPSQVYMFSMPWPCVHIRCTRFFCLYFSHNFNIMSAIFVHQSPTLPQKIDSREGLFWCKIGVTCAWVKMNIYLNKTPFAPISGLFAANCSAFWCK